MSAQDEVRKASKALYAALNRMAKGDAGPMAVEQGHITLAGSKVDFEHRVTNVYRREVGGWKIVHHHTDISPAMVEVVKGLK